jgi:hypothetical protein
VNIVDADYKKIRSLFGSRDTSFGALRYEMSRHFHKTGIQ